MTLDDIRKEIEAHSPYPILEPITQKDNVVYVILARPLASDETMPGTHLAATMAISQLELDEALYPLTLIYTATQAAVRRLSGGEDETGEPPC